MALPRSSNLARRGDSKVRERALMTATGHGADVSRPSFIPYQYRGVTDADAAAVHAHIAAIRTRLQARKDGAS